MALTVEDGTGVTSADAYQTLAAFRAYHTDYGNASVTGLSDAATEILIRKASRAIDAMYGRRLQGQRWKTTQGLQAPRYPVYHSDGFEIGTADQLVILGRACAELGLRAYTEDIYPDLDVTGAITSESASVGSISESKTYAGGSIPVKSYRIVDDIMAELLGAGALNMKVERS